METTNNTSSKQQNTKKTAKKIELKIKEEYQHITSVKARRSGSRKDISMTEIKKNPVKAIYDHHLEYLFENSDDEILDIIKRVDKNKGLTEKEGYKTRALRGKSSVESHYDVL